MKNKTYIVIGIFVAIIIIAAVYLAFPKKPSQPGKYDDFAKCLTEKGAAMYGAYWCSHCAAQKEMFGDSFKYINYVECDPNGQNAKPELCQQVGIQGYPTWIINGETYEGVRQLAELASVTNCALPA